MLTMDPPAATGARSVADLTGTLHVVHTKSRCEKAVAQELDRFGVPTYLPLFKKNSILNGYKSITLHPAIPGYVFCALEDTYELLRWYPLARRVCSIRPAKFQERMREQLTKLERHIEKYPYLISQTTTPAGTIVLVSAGSLAGKGGAFIGQSRSGKTKRMECSMFGGSVMEVKDAPLEREADRN